MNLENVEIVIYGLIIFTIISFIFYWKGNYHKSDKFKVFFSALGGIAVVFGIFALIIQGLSFKENIKSKNVEFFDNLTKSFVHDILHLFIDNQDMNYYYEDIMGINPINSNTIRNLTKENEISMLIYTKASSIIYYIETEKNNEITNEIQKSFNNTMYRYLNNSPTFKNYWKLYNENLGGYQIQMYFKKYFGL